MPEGVAFLNYLGHPFYQDVVGLVNKPAVRYLVHPVRVVAPRQAVTVLRRHHHVHLRIERPQALLSHPFNNLNK